MKNLKNNIVNVAPKATVQSVAPNPKETDPLSKTKERMKHHGVLKFFLESLRPENREIAWD